MLTATEMRIEELVRSRDDLILNGWTDREIAAAVRDGTLFHIRRGWFIDAAERTKLWPEGRHRAHVIAVARDSFGRAVASHTSAAVLWRLPLYKVRCKRVHMTTGTDARISSGQDVMRHISPLPPDDVVIIDGIRCTSLARTVFDLIRVLPLTSAVAVADAAERQMADRQWEWDLDAVTSWRRQMQQRLDAGGGACGVRQARWVGAFADGKAQLPGESVSRLQLHRLGFDPPQLQVPFDGPDRSEFFIDFGMADVRSFGEFDGKTKYLDEAMRAGKTIEEVILAEKRREDWIRGRTQWKFARWESEHIATPRLLAQRLSAFGIHAP